MTPLTYLNKIDKQEPARINPWYLTGRKAVNPAGGPRADKTERVNKWSILELHNGQGRSVNEFATFAKVFEGQMCAYGMTNFDIFTRDAGWAAHKISLGNGLQRALTDTRTWLTEAKVRTNSLFVIVVIPIYDVNLYARVKKIADQQVGINVVCLVPKRGRLHSGDNQFNVRANMISKLNLKSSSLSAGHYLQVVLDLLKGANMVVGMDVVSRMCPKIL